MTIRNFRNRTLTEGQKVFVYFNLHKKCYSIRDYQSGLIVAHADSLNLKDVTWTVNQRGRERVLEEQVKNVHAGLFGTYTEEKMIILDTTQRATYNPYKYDSFVNLETEQPLDESSQVGLAKGAMYYR